MGSDGLFWKRNLARNLQFTGLLSGIGRLAERPATCRFSSRWIGNIGYGVRWTVWRGKEALRAIFCQQPTITELLSNCPTNDAHEQQQSQDE